MSNNYYFRNKNAKTLDEFVKYFNKTYHKLAKTENDLFDKWNFEDYYKVYANEVHIGQTSVGNTFNFSYDDGTKTLPYENDLDKCLTWIAENQSEIIIYDENYKEYTYKELIDWISKRNGNSFNQPTRFSQILEADYRTTYGEFS